MELLRVSLVSISAGEVSQALCSDVLSPRNPLDGIPRNNRGSVDSLEWSIGPTRSVRNGTYPSPELGICSRFADEIEVRSLIAIRGSCCIVGSAQGKAFDALQCLRYLFPTRQSHAVRHSLEFLTVENIEGNAAVIHRDLPNASSRRG